MNRDDDETKRSDLPIVSSGNPVDARQREFEQCQSGLRAFLRSRLSQESDVDDCLQAVGIALVEKGSEVAPAAMRSWLFRVAANEAARIWRSRASQDKAFKNYASPNIELSDPLQNSLQSETAAALRAAVQRLPKTWQIVVRLRIHEDLTFQQIADQLGIPLGTALSQMSRALEQLRRDLSRDHDK